MSKLVKILKVLGSYQVRNTITLGFSIGLFLGLIGGVVRSMFIIDLNQKRFAQIAWSIGGAAVGLVVGLIISAHYAVSEWDDITRA